MSMVIPVTGVPFIKQTRANKTINISKREDTKIVLDVVSQTIDAPYSDCFLCKESWLLLTDSPNSHRCIVQKYVKVHFVKSTMFKNKILARAEEGLRDAAKAWLQNA